MANLKDKQRLVNPVSNVTLSIFKLVDKLIIDTK